jgi:hypothetical protein
MACKNNIIHRMLKPPTVVVLYTDRRWFYGNFLGKSDVGGGKKINKKDSY